MITLFRMCILKYLKTKWELAFWMELNKQANELIKHPENIETKVLQYLAEIIHASANSATTNENAFLVKGQKNG